MRIKSFESPRSLGQRKSKGPKASARQRQLKKASKRFIAKLRDQSQG